MRVKLGIAGLLFGLAAWPSAVGASGAEACEPTWALVAPTLNCASRIVVGPGNDTRVNLLLLVRDRAGLDGQGLAYQADGWLTSYYGHTFFDWDVLNATLDPSLVTADYDPYASPPEFYGRRCQSVAAGGEQFLAAVDRNRRIGVADRRALAEGREAIVGLCHTEADHADYDVRPAAEDLGLPHTFASPEAREFGTYLAGAAAFYISDWRSARERFAVLRTAKDAWVRETALYMAARSELGAAAATAVGQWGEFDVDEADKGAAGRAAKAFEGYLAAYPGGSYAASAAGLVRRAQWLEGAVDKQGRTYARLLDAVDPEQARDLIVEIDDKFLFRDGAGDAAEGPLLLAVHDLLRMRNCNEPGQPEYSCGDTIAPLTAGDLAAQEAAFAGHAELYAFVQANFAFYVAHDYRAVLRLLPDDARQPAYSPLAFSRQVLRGMALAELEDRNEAGFWQELIGGAKGVYQRPTIELGLALNWERAGQVAKVFAPGSPIEDAPIRRVLLEHSAGPEVLRAVAGAADRPRDERDLATYVLLYKELSRGSYAAVGRDLALVRAEAPTESYSETTYEAQIPAGQFLRGRFSDQYACTALRQTVAQLARDPRDAKARLCLGDFYRLNGFDDLYLDFAPPAGALGSFAAYPGTPIPRSTLYADVIGEAGVAREERAYALYRAVYCYAPSGYSSCGGEQVSEAQRREWFRRLKSEFGDIRWGREIEYYW